MKSSKDIQALKEYIIKDIQEVVRLELLGFNTNAEMSSNIEQAMWTARDVLAAIDDYETSK